MSIHVPLTEATHHLIGAAELALMRSTAILINTARGPIVDETALVEALQKRTIAGAGLDVYEDERASIQGSFCCLRPCSCRMWFGNVVGTCADGHDLP